MSSLYVDDGPKAIGKKIMLATTAYDSPDASYTFSIAKSREALTESGFQSAYVLLSGNCHVDDARNSVVKEFLQSDCTDLVFIDADVSWEPEQLVALCKHDLPLVGGVYPYRRADKQLMGDMPVRMLDGAEVVDGLLEVEGLPTGFMKIKRHVLEKLSLEADHFIKSDASVPIIFERTFDGTNRWGGDIMFCNKWRATGGKIYADYEMRLGHVAKTVFKGSLGEALRRRAGTTLRHVCDKIKANTFTASDLTEAREYVNNHFGALEDVLYMSVLSAKKANGPIIETGSGLTTILMAAATDQIVYCLEHHGLWAAKLKQLAAEAGVTNIGLCVCDIKDGWYDLSDMDLPDRFALGLNDGPPRTVGSRMGFFKHLADRCDTIICDDADNKGYNDKLIEWAKENNCDIDFVEPRSVLISKSENKEAA